MGGGGRKEGLALGVGAGQEKHGRGNEKTLVPSERDEEGEDVTKVDHEPQTNLQDSSPVTIVNVLHILPEFSLNSPN